MSFQQDFFSLKKTKNKTFLISFPVFLLMGFARFSFPIIAFYFLVFFVMGFGVSCFILKVLGIRPVVSPVSN